MNKIDTDLDKGRNWLLTAERRFGEDEDPSAAHAAAMIGHGFIALAHAERAAASMAEVSQVRQAILSLSDAPLTAGEACERHPDSESCAVCTPVALPVAAASKKRAEAEARPHDEPAPKPTCSFVFLGKRCTFQPGHHLFWHRLEDGAEVNDEGEPMATEPDTCSFVRDGVRCVLAPAHALGHELADGRGYPLEADRG